MDDNIIDDAWYKVPPSDGCYEWNRKGSNYIHLDEQENAIDSLESAATFLVRDDNLKWKWVAWALHHSLYMFCISALENGNYENVLDHGDHNIFIQLNGGLIEKSVRIPFLIEQYKTSAFRISWEVAEQFPEIMKKQNKKNPNLISFWTALARVMDGHFWMARLCGQKPLVLNDEEMGNIVWLADRVRNDIMHFTPKGYLITIYDLLQCSATYLKAIEFLSLDSFAVHFMNAEQAIQRITTALNTINEVIIYELNKMEKQNE